MKPSDRVLRVTLLISVVATALGGAGCSDAQEPEPSESRHKTAGATIIEEAFENQIQSLRRALEDPSPDAPKKLLEAYQVGLDRLLARQVSDRPYVLYASVEPADYLPSERAFLWVDWLELDHDAEGILILERDVETGRTVCVERYPLFAPPQYPRDKIKPYILMNSPVIGEVRWRPPGLDCSEDIVAWQKWARNPTSDGWPPAPVWISRPGEGRLVELAVYDGAGYISNVVEVQLVGDGQK